MESKSWVSSIWPLLVLEVLAFFMTEFWVPNVAGLIYTIFDFDEVVSFEAFFPLLAEKSIFLIITVLPDSPLDSTTSDFILDISDINAFKFFLLNSYNFFLFPTYSLDILFPPSTESSP